MKWWVLFFLMMTTVPAGALGLASVYPQGGTQIELQGQREAEETSEGALIGYGISSWLNPSLSITQIHGGEESRVRTGVGSLSEWSAGFARVVFAPAYFKEEDLNHFHLNTEAAYDLDPRWTPYGRIGWESTEGQGGHPEWCTGLRWSGADLEVIVEGHEKLQVWRMGLNWRWDRNIEINLEAALPPVEQSWGIALILHPEGIR